MGPIDNGELGEAFAAVRHAISKAKGENEIENNSRNSKGWCLGCRQRGGECQCAELGTDPEWVEHEPPAKKESG